MRKLHMFTLFFAVLVILTFAACGDAVQESSEPEGLETWGEEINPSAEPSAGQVVTNPPTSDAPVVVDPNATGVGESDTQPSGAPAAPATSAAPTTAAPAASPRPSSGGNSGGNNTTPKPSTSPAPPSEDPDHPVISPPVSASTATADDARAYIGKSRSELFAGIGYPASSDYRLIDEEDPDAGEIGTLYYNGFTVTTKKTADGETVTGVS